MSQQITEDRIRGTVTISGLTVAQCADLRLLARTALGTDTSAVNPVWDWDSEAYSLSLPYKAFDMSAARGELTGLLKAWRVLSTCEPGA